MVEKKTKPLCTTKGCIVKTQAGEHQTIIKSCYVREGHEGKFVKIGYWCPKCHRFYLLKEVKK